MFGTTVLDKDGVSAAAVMAEYAGWLHSQNKTFHSHLEEIFLRLAFKWSEAQWVRVDYCGFLLVLLLYF